MQLCKCLSYSKSSETPCLNLNIETYRRNTKFNFNSIMKSSTLRLNWLLNYPNNRVTREFLKKLRPLRCFSWNRKNKSKLNLMSSADALSTGMILSNGRTRSSTRLLKSLTELRFPLKLLLSNLMLMVMALLKEESSSPHLMLYMSSILHLLRWISYGTL